MFGFLVNHLTKFARCPELGMGSHVRSDFSFRDPKPGKFLHQIGKEVGVGVAMLGSNLLGLEVDVVPGDAVGKA